jgi:hypothetical protein
MRATRDASSVIVRLDIGYRVVEGTWARDDITSRHGLARHRVRDLSGDKAKVKTTANRA